MFCTKCGNKLKDNQKFCSKCGNKVDLGYGYSLLEQTGSSLPKCITFELDRGFKDNFFKLSGRLNRKRFIKRVIVVGVAASILCGVVVSGMGTHTLRGYFYLTVPLLKILWLPFLYSLYVRRLHDLNQDNKMAIVVIASELIGSGASAYLSHMEWRFGIFAFGMASSTGLSALGFMLGLIHMGILIYMIFVDGTHGSNRYGSDPLNRTPKI